MPLTLALLLLHNAVGCGRARRAEVVEERASSRPVARVGGGRPLEQVEAAMLERQRRFLSAEGMAARGPLFAQLAMEVGKAASSGGRRCSAFELYALLGQPDLVRRQGGIVTVQYLYNRFGQQDWVTFFEIDADGAVHWHGLNAATPASRRGFEPFRGYLETQGHAKQKQ
jgi:hypothetical protein